MKGVWRLVKKWILSLTISLLILLAINTQAGYKEGFEGIRWGTDFSVVAKLVNFRLLYRPIDSIIIGCLAATAEDNNRPIKSCLVFYNGALAEAHIFYEGTNESKLDLFVLISDRISSKLGKPYKVEDYRIEKKPVWLVYIWSSAETTYILHLETLIDEYNLVLTIVNTDMYMFSNSKIECVQKPPAPIKK